MSYTPTNWKAGDTVTSAKLNKIEQGIVNAEGANILVANCILDSSNTSEDTSGGVRSAASATTNRLDKTLGEILNADFVIVKIQEDNELIYSFIAGIMYSEEDQIYGIVVSVGTRRINFIAQNENEYPTIDTSNDDSGYTPE